MFDIRITKTEVGFVAECRDLKLAGAGKTLREALIDLASGFEYFVEHYKNIPEDKLMGAARDLKKKYAEL